MFPAAGMRPHGRNTAATRYPRAGSGTWGLTSPPPPPVRSPRPPSSPPGPPSATKNHSARVPGTLRLIPSGIEASPDARPEARPAATAWSASRRAPTAAARPPRPGTSRGRPCAAAPWRRAARRPCPPGCAVETGHPPSDPAGTQGRDPGSARTRGRRPWGPALRSAPHTTGSKAPWLEQEDPCWP